MTKTEQTLKFVFVIRRRQINSKVCSIFVVEKSNINIAFDVDMRLWWWPMK